MTGSRLTICVVTSIVMLAGVSDGWTLSPTKESSYPGDSTSAESDGARDLEGYRQKGDLQSERRHVWAVFTRLMNAVVADALPAFESWYGEGAVFADAGAEDAVRGVRGFLRATPNRDSSGAGNSVASQSADTPILAYTLYNLAAYNHIRSNRLYLVSELARLNTVALADPSVVDDRTVPPFPRSSIVIKTAWWPIAHDRLTPLPVWDPDHNPPRRGGNDYLSWRRVVAVDPIVHSRTTPTAPIQFAGQLFQDAHRVDLRAFYSVRINHDMARNLMLDQSAHKAALVVLGRPIESGDYLVLVGVNLATKEIDEWVWGALWWHDRADEGPFAAGRPTALRSPWRNYLLQVAFDTDKPVAGDGGPHICFNPWLEGRFPDGGHGGGRLSNCLACHRRASYPPVDFLPVTRGAPDLINDPAYARGRLRTNFIWSMAMHSR